MTLTKTQFEAFSEKDRMNRSLEGKAYWARVQSPKHSEKFNTDTFEVHLGVDAENAAKAVSYGLQVKPADKNCPMPHVLIKRKVKPGIDPKTIKPTIVDAMQQPVADTTLIGNESTVIVKFGTYWYETAGGGVGTVMFKVQIRNLVVFKPSDKSLVMDTAGYHAVESAEPIFDQA